MANICDVEICLTLNIEEYEAISYEARIEG